MLFGSWQQSMYIEVPRRDSAELQMLCIPDLLPCKCNIYQISIRLEMKSRPVEERGVREILDLKKKNLNELVQHAKFFLGN